MNTLVASALAALVLSAPRTDGIYVGEASFGLLDGVGVSADELVFVEYVSFTPTTATVHLTQESEEFPWRATRGGFEGQGRDGRWAARPWREYPGGIVETTLLGRTRVRFVEGTLEQRIEEVRAGFTRAQLARLAGSYGEGAEALTIDADGVRGGASGELRALQCFPDCASQFPSVCFETAALVLLETPAGLLRLPRAYSACGSYTTGLATRDGVLLRRDGRPEAAGAPVATPQVSAALTARAQRLARCNDGKRPRKVKLTLQVARSGLLTSVDAGSLTTCVTGVLARMGFPPQGEPSTVTVDWVLGPRR